MARKGSAQPKLRSARATAPIETPAKQPTANPSRGEHQLVLAGVTYRLRPSRAAVRAIEEKTGKSTLELVSIGNSGGLRLAQLGVIAAQLVHAGAEDDLTRMITAERFEDLIFEQGLAGPMARFTLCLLDAATGGRTASGNVQAASA
jgi:hypothetical protein